MRNTNVRKKMKKDTKKIGTVKSVKKTKKGIEVVFKPDLNYTKTTHTRYEFSSLNIHFAIEVDEKTKQIEILNYKDDKEFVFSDSLDKDTVIRWLDILDLMRKAVAIVAQDYSKNL